MPATTLEDLGQDQINELALLARELSDNPDTRPDFLRGMKKIRPGTPVPELELDDRLKKTEQSYLEKIASMEGKMAEREMRDRLDKVRQGLIDSGKARNLDEVTEIEKVMLDKKIADHESGADYWNWMKQAATPTPAAYDTSFMNKDNRTVLADYWKNPAGAARQNAAQAINDFKKLNRAG